MYLNENWTILKSSYAFKSQKGNFFTDLKWCFDFTSFVSLTNVYVPFQIQSFKLNLEHLH